MNWNAHKQTLTEGQRVQCRPKGQSMTPRIRSGQLITIDPDVSKASVGDVVFCKVNGHFYVHLVKAVGQDGRLLIGNAHGHINGWTKAIYGMVVRVED